MLSPPADLAIIGGGAAGTVVAIQALRAATGPRHVLLLEASATLGQGIAYSTPRPEHLLNVPVARMSAFPDQPEDFLDYLQSTAAFPELARDVLATRFVARHHFASYLQQRLEEAIVASPARLQIVRQTVVALRGGTGARSIQLADGGVLHACSVVLACGNSLRPLSLQGAQALDTRQLAEAWDHEGVRQLAGTEAIGIIGSGLSMVDSVSALLAAGYSGPIHVYSRHGIMPLPHAHGAAATFDPQPLLAMTLRQRVRTLRGHVRSATAAGVPWQSVMERIRPLGQMLWRSLDAADQRRFLRHVVRYWDVHRHRIDAGVHAQLVALRSEGRLQLHRCRMQDISADAAGLHLTARQHEQVVHWRLAGLVNATGVETRAALLSNPLLRQLLEEGVARPGPHGLGLDTEADSGALLDAHGEVCKDIVVLGSLRIGTLWESLAIPELRGQAAQAAHAVVREPLGPRPA